MRKLFDLFRFNTTEWNEWDYEKGYFLFCNPISENLNGNLYGVELTEYYFYAVHCTPIAGGQIVSSQKSIVPIQHPATHTRKRHEIKSIIVGTRYQSPVRKLIVSNYLLIECDMCEWCKTHSNAINRIRKLYETKLFISVYFIWLNNNLLFSFRAHQVRI